MIPQKEGRKAVPDPGQEARTQPSTVMQFPFQLLLQGCPQGAGHKHRLALYQPAEDLLMLPHKDAVGPPSHPEGSHQALPREWGGVDYDPHPH